MFVGVNRSQVSSDLGVPVVGNRSWIVGEFVHKFPKIHVCSVSVHHVFHVPLYGSHPTRIRGVARERGFVENSQEDSKTATAQIGNQRVTPIALARKVAVSGRIDSVPQLESAIVHAPSKKVEPSRRIHT